MADSAATTIRGAVDDAGPSASPRALPGTCPHCGAVTAGLPALAIVDCGTCGRSYRTGRSPDERAAGPTHGGTPFVTIEARSPTDVGLLRTGALGGVATLVFYGAVVMPLSDTYFGDLFGARGWVPYVITWLSAWAAMLLGAKASLLRPQQKALALDLLPENISGRVTRENAGTFQRHLGGLAGQELKNPRLLGGGSTRSFLVERVERALDHLAIRGRARDVIDQLGTQSQLDRNAVESSYTMVRVFIWAIPLLGFIGTVLGISAAVAGFSDSVASAVDLDVMKQSIGTVTTGLGVAFDTTLLALVMSIFIMFPTSSLQKSEEDFLDRVELYCDQRLARRLDDSGETMRPTDGHEAMAAFTTLADSAAQGLAQLEKQLADLSNTVGTLDSRLRHGASDEDGEPRES